MYDQHILQLQAELDRTESNHKTKQYGILLEERYSGFQLKSNQQVEDFEQTLLKYTANVLFQNNLTMWCI